MFRGRIMYQPGSRNMGLKPRNKARNGREHYLIKMESEHEGEEITLI